MELIYLFLLNSIFLNLLLAALQEYLFYLLSFIKAVTFYPNSLIATTVECFTFLLKGHFYFFSLNFLPPKV